MRLLLDNCVPARFAKLIDGHSVETVVTTGWAALKDGEFLDRMAGRFDVLITVDRSLPFQQRLDNRPLAVVILRAPSNRLADLRPLLPALLAALDQTTLGQVREI